MLLVMGIIFFFSHQPGDSLHLPSVPPGLDKIGHLFAYGLLALTVLWFLGSAKQAILSVVALKTVIFCLLYGITDEWHQSFVPLRSVSTFDLMADLTGAIVVSAIWWINRNFRARLSSCYMFLATMLEDS